MSLKPVRPGHPLTWVGLIIASAISAFALVMLIGEAFGGDPYAVEDGSRAEGVGVVVIVLLIVASTAYAWSRHREGGLAIMGVGVLLALFVTVTAGSNVLLAAGSMGGAVFISGLLTWLGSQRESGWS